MNPPGPSSSEPPLASVGNEEIDASCFQPEGTPELSTPFSPITPDLAVQLAPTEREAAQSVAGAGAQLSEDQQFSGQDLSVNGAPSEFVLRPEATLLDLDAALGRNENTDRVSRKRTLSLAFLDEMLDGPDFSNAVSIPPIPPLMSLFDDEDLILPAAHAPADIPFVEGLSELARAQTDVHLAASPLVVQKESRFSPPANLRLPAICDGVEMKKPMPVAFFKGNSWGAGWTYFATRGRGASPGARPTMNKETKARLDAGGVSRADLTRAAIGVEPWTSRELCLLEKEVKRMQTDPEFGNPDKWSLSQWESLRVRAGLSHSAADAMCRHKNAEHPSASNARLPWTPSEDSRLLAAAPIMDATGWAGVSARVGGHRGSLACLRRFVHHCTRRSAGERRPWTAGENARLREAAAAHADDWVSVALIVGTRDRQACLHHFRKQLMPGRAVGKWDAAEVAQLREAVRREGGGCWKRVAERVPGRSDVQCREKWVNSMAPTIARGKFGEGESALLLALAFEKKDRWASIAAVIPWRTPKQCRRRIVRLRDLATRGYRAGKKARK